MQHTAHKKTLRQILGTSLLGIGGVALLATSVSALTIPPLPGQGAGPFGSIQIKEVISGGTANVSDITVHLKKSGTADTGTPSGSGNTIIFAQIVPGTYTVIESGVPSGYKTAWSGDCNAQAQVTIAPNATAACTVTHTWAPQGTGGGSGGSGGSRGGNGSGGGSGSGGVTQPPRPPRQTR